MVKVEVSFEINGRKVSPQNWGNAVERALLENLKEQIQDKLRGVRCAEHNQQPRVTVAGSSLDQLSFQVHGCCQKLIDQATKALDG